MKNRKLISIVLVLTLMIALSVPAYANTRDSDTMVGILTIFASDDTESSSDGSAVGHAFLSFKNTSGAPITIGLYTVSPNTEITFGTWGHFVTGGSNAVESGIWYNRESYFIHHKDELGNRISHSISIYTSDIPLLNSILNDDDNDSYNLLTNNCVHFALRVWNTFAVQQFSVIVYSPIHLQNELLDHTGYQMDRPVQQNDNVYYVSNGRLCYELPS